MKALLPQHTSCSSDILESDCGGSPGKARDPGGYSLTWFIRVRAAEQGMFFGFAVLNRVHNLTSLCPKQF